MITIIQEDLSDIDNRPVDSSASGDDKENMTTVVRNILLGMLYSVQCTLYTGVHCSILKSSEAIGNYSDKSSFQ